MTILWNQQACPDCCMDELLRIAGQSNVSIKQKTAHQGKDASPTKKQEKKQEKSTATPKKRNLAKNALEKFKSLSSSSSSVLPSLQDDNTASLTRSSSENSKNSWLTRSEKSIDQPGIDYTMPVVEPPRIRLSRSRS